MAHIHTQPGQHDATTSAFIVRADGPEPAVLLHLHKKLGTYMQFGGHIELNETPWQAIVHEVKEESGYDMSQLKLLQPKQRLMHLSGADLHPYPVCINTHSFPDLNHFHSDIGYAFVVDGPPSVQVSGDESKTFMRITRDELVALPKELIIDNVREIGLFVLDVCLRDWQQITPPQNYPKN